MRRAKQLFEKVPLRENLLLATTKALRGKRSKADARAWVAGLDHHLESLSREIQSGELQVGVARQFLIHDPKERLITAPGLQTGAATEPGFARDGLPGSPGVCDAHRTEPPEPGEVRPQVARN